MIDVGELKRGITIELDGQLWNIVELEHIKVGRGGAVVRIKLRNLMKGSLVERTFPASERFKRVYLERRKVQFLYNDEEGYHFMDTETYDQFNISAEMVGDDANYLKEGIELEIMLHDEYPIGIELPITVNLEVTEAEIGLKGDTATGATKNVTVETGLRVSVPLFVNQGDTIKVDTRSGKYLERVK